MRSAALIIGIDEYDQPDWRLRGAVRDALAFARWVCSPEGGGVEGPPQLLLRPAPTHLPEGWTVTEPTSMNCGRAIDAFREGARDGIDRLYVFFSGHGIAARGGGKEDAPQLVTSDLRTANEVARYGLNLGSFLADLRLHGPAEQLYFIDACREAVVAPEVMTIAVNVWSPTAIKSEGAVQAVLYATTAGKVANELSGRGLFTQALLRGLEASAGVVVRHGGAQSYQLRFKDLARYVQTDVSKALSRILRDGRGLPDQLPTWGIAPEHADPILRTFKIPEVPRTSWKIRIEPRQCREAATVEILADNPVTLEPAPALSMGPVPEPVWKIEAPNLGHHLALQVSAPGFYTRQLGALDLHHDGAFFVELEEDKGGMLESFDPSGRRTTPPGALIVQSPDARIRVSVLDAMGHVVQTDLGGIPRVRIPAGRYAIQAALPGVQPFTTSVELSPMKTSTVVLKPPPLPDRELAAFVQRTVGDGTPAEDPFVGECLVQPGPELGPVADLRVGSLLGWLAWAARWPAAKGAFARLRTVRIPEPDLSSTGAGLLVLLGDGRALQPGDRPFQGKAIVRLDGIDELSCLPGLPLALGATAPLPLGPSRVTVDVPGFMPTAFPVVGIAGFVSVLVFSRESWGAIEVAQHLLPVDPTEGANPEDFPAWEQAPRALAEGLPLLDGESGAWSNPLAAAVCGFRLLAEGDRVRLRGLVTSALAAWPRLPDLHVLAAQIDPGSRGAHLAAAAQAGTPLLTRAWKLAQEPGTPQEAPLEGQIWTSFAERKPTP